MFQGPGPHCQAWERGQGPWNMLLANHFLWHFPCCCKTRCTQDSHRHTACLTVLLHVSVLCGFYGVKGYFLTCTLPFCLFTWHWIGWVSDLYPGAAGSFSPRFSPCPPLWTVLADRSSGQLVLNIGRVCCLFFAHIQLFYCCCLFSLSQVTELSVTVIFPTWQKWLQTEYQLEDPA